MYSKKDKADKPKCKKVDTAKIVELSMQGLSYQKIAEQLGISRRTVGIHLQKHRGNS